MWRKKLYPYLTAIICFLVTSLPFFFLAAEEIPRMRISDGQRTENQKGNAHTENQPRITFDDTKYDAGVVFEGAKVTHSFTVKNTGTAELTIERVKVG